MYIQIAPMTERQKLAIENPQARATGGCDPQFWREVRYKGLGLSTILTVNK